MDYHPENEIRDILELREWIAEEIEKKEKELDKMKQNLRILDSLVKQSSFSKASSLISSGGKPAQQTAVVIPMKTQDDQIIANAHVTPEELVIIPAEDIILDIDTQPFKSFFLGRIIGNMESQDNAEVQNGKISQNSAISYMVNKDGNQIKEILIRNYRQKERLDEIINTATWSFGKMMENSKK